MIARKADINAIDANGNTALHRAASDVWEDEVEFLISSGANVNAVDLLGNTPLHSAAKDNAVNVIQRLISADASVNTKNAAGQTPLAVANLTMQKEAAGLIKSKGGTE